MASGVILDLQDNQYAGLSGSDYYFDVADTTAPAVASVTPANASTAQPNDVTFVITFDEDVQVMRACCSGVG